MKGVFFLGDRRLELREVPDPEPGPGDVVVEVRASGMCGSDLHQYRAPATAVGDQDRRIAGHEPAGVVHAVGDGVQPGLASVGDRVMVHHYDGCGYCAFCRAGWTQMCSTAPVRVFGTDLHGAHAPYLRVPAATLVPLPDRLTFTAGAAIGCGTGTAWGGLDRLGDVGGATIAVFGQGPVGLSGTMLAAARGARVIAIDVVAERLSQARRLGAEYTVNGLDGDVVQGIRELTDGRGVDLVLETSGANAAAADALRALAPWGRACFVGIGCRVEFTVLDQLRSQMTLMTSWSMSIVQQQRCAEFVNRHQLPVDDLFTHRWSLDQAAAAYEEFDRQTAGKGVFVW